VEISERALDDVERDKWSRLVEASPDSTPFSDWSWLELVHRAMPGWHVRCVVAEEDGRYVAGMPLVANDAGMVHQSHSMAFGTPAGPMQVPGGDSRSVDEVLRWWIERNASGWPATRLGAVFDGDTPADVGILEECGFRIERQTAYRISLEGRTFAEWERSLSQQVRNKNRQALDRAATFEHVEDPNLAPAHEAHSHNTARPHHPGRVYYRERFFRALLERQQREGRGIARLVLVRLDGRPSAYDLCVVHRGRMWLIDHGGDTMDFHARTNNLLYRSIVEWAFAEGLAEVDLGAVPSGAHALARFKVGFGALPCERISAIKTNFAFRVAFRAGHLLGR
jgi:predicted N-acyltransferase